MFTAPGAAGLLQALNHSNPKHTPEEKHTFKE